MNPATVWRPAVLGLLLLLISAPSLASHGRAYLRAVEVFDSNGDGLLTPGETARIRIQIECTGRRQVSYLDVDLHSDSTPHAILTNERWEADFNCYSSTYWTNDDVTVQVISIPPGGRLHFDVDMRYYREGSSSSRSDSDFGTFSITVTPASAPPPEPPPSGLCLREDGEGYSNGTSIAGWNVSIDPNAAGRTTMTAVTSQANGNAVHSGSGALRINGDFPLGKQVPACRGTVLRVDYWHNPQPGKSTNSMMALYGPGRGQQQYISVHKNDRDLWYVQGQEVASYSGRYTHVVVTINTTTALFDVAIDDRLVVSQRKVDNAAHIGEGIHYISFHSGRGGTGTDSFVDDLLITTSGNGTPPTEQIIFDSDVNSLAIRPTSSLAISLEELRRKGFRFTVTVSDGEVRVTVRDTTNQRRIVEASAMALALPETRSVSHAFVRAVADGRRVHLNPKGARSWLEFILEGIASFNDYASAIFFAAGIADKLEEGDREDWLAQTIFGPAARNTHDVVMQLVLLPPQGSNEVSLYVPVDGTSREIIENLYAWGWGFVITGLNVEPTTALYSFDAMGQFLSSLTPQGQ